MRKMNSGRWCGAVALTVFAAMLTGCATSSVTPSRALDINMLNGATLPGEMARMVDESTMLDTIGADGMRIVIERGIRKAGTRAAIHIHEHGGTTCALTGEVTVFMEGHAPAKWPAGTCYYMPPHTLMAAANLGTEDVVMIDTFILPPKMPTITVREPGYPAHH